MKNKEQGF